MCVSEWVSVFVSETKKEKERGVRRGERVCVRERECCVCGRERESESERDRQKDRQRENLMTVVE